MQSLGQRLRQAREAKGLTIEQIAAETRIHADYLHALEADDPAACPGGFFYRSFVRQYSRTLGLPEAAFQSVIEESLRAEERELDSKPTQLIERKLDLPPLPTGRVNRARDLRRGLLRLVALAAVLAACAGVYALYERWGTVTDYWTAKPVEQHAVAPPAPQSSATPSQPAASAPVAGQEQIAAPAAQPARMPGRAADTPAPVPDASAAEAAAVHGAGPVEVRLNAREVTWVEVSADGQRLWSDLLRAGAARTFRGRLLRVRLGNAGGVDVSWNGKSLPPFGPPGQVRTVRFTAGEYEVLAPVKTPVAAPPPAPPDR